MDIFTVTIEHQELYEQPPYTGGFSFDTEVTINDLTLPDILDIDTFFQSIQENGRFPLFTCTCGIFGCGGYYVDVTNTARLWILKNRYHPLDEHLLEAFEYRVGQQQVKEAAQKIVKHLQALHTQYPKEVITSGVAGEVNLAERIADYLKSPLLL